MFVETFKRIVCKNAITAITCEICEDDFDVSEVDYCQRKVVCKQCQMDSNYKFFASY